MTGRSRIRLLIGLDRTVEALLILVRVLKTPLVKSCFFAPTIMDICDTPAEILARLRRFR